MSDGAPAPDDDRVAQLTAQLAALRAQLVALEQRALEAETIAVQLAEQLADAQQRLAEAATSGPPEESDDSALGLFATTTAPTAAVRPATDRAVVPLALGALAVVALLLFVVALVVRGVSPVALAALVAAAGLGWAAYRTRFVPTAVTVEHGVVVIRRGDATKRFDLASDQVRLDVRGQPGDPDWRVRFYRRSLEPVDVDATMVEPETFLRRLREHRPDA